MRLSPDAVPYLPYDVQRPDYDYADQKTGIVHFGIGAFHRAHQAVYTDDAMGVGDRDWGITGVSLRSPGVRDAMAPQACLYTVTSRDTDDVPIRLIGAVRNVFVAPESPDAIIAAIASPDARIITLTITEKGYRPDAPDGSKTMVSAYDFLAAGLARRKAAGLPGLTLLSCDNLADNGAQLAGFLGDHLDRYDAGLAVWFRGECACPSTMVDRIVPAPTSHDRALIAARIGVHDEAALATEPFRQWVIEDRFAGPRPRWEAGGAEFVADVRPYELAKLRMLNGAHSALAYLGLERGHAYVHEAVTDPALLPVIDRLMRQEAAASVSAAPDQNLTAYADRLMARFANAALPHRLIQIAMDGSQKIPQRWLETLAWHQREGQRCPAILGALAAWIMFVRGAGQPVDDPLATRFAALWRDFDADGVVDALVGSRGLFAQHWIASESDREWLRMTLKAKA